MGGGCGAEGVTLGPAAAFVGSRVASLEDGAEYTPGGIMSQLEERCVGVTNPEIAMWETRFGGEDYLFGTDPNAFLVRSTPRIPDQGRILAVADGEGRNGVWLAEQGFAVHSVEGSERAVAKAQRLARERGVRLADSLAELEPGALFAEVGDVLHYPWPQRSYDAVVAIFIQFAKPGVERESMFAAMIQSLKTDGVLLLEGYTPRQLEFGTGGPKAVEHMYTEDFLRDVFSGMRIDAIDAYDAELDEGAQHSGMSAVIDLTATKIR